MSPKEITQLYHENDSPLWEMWPDQLYAQIIDARVNSIVERIMLGSLPPPVSNGLNIFSTESGIPLRVC
ncbi:hypothetical protein HY031_02430, partial [Candidatus Gottesmanbacteria bacterium]|nr:hypothetical protein [Candidatus Gottesmanbacteria bacterium]